MVVRLGVGGLRGRDLRLERRDLGVLGRRQVVLLGERLGMGLVLRLELRRELDQLVARQRRQLRGERRVELLAGRHALRVRRVAVGREHDDVEQLAQHLQRGLRLDRAALVGGGVADPADQVELLRDPDADLGLERRVVDPCREVVLVRRAAGPSRRTGARRAARSLGGCRSTPPPDRSTGRTPRATQSAWTAGRRRP